MTGSQPSIGLPPPPGPQPESESLVVGVEVKCCHGHHHHHNHNHNEGILSTKLGTVPLAGATTATKADYGDLEAPGGAWEEEVSSSSSSSSSSSTRRRPQRLRKRGQARVVDVSQLPKDYPVRPFVRSGYRIDYTAWECALSVFAWHNETLNIWSHLAGLVAWMFMLWRATHSATFGAADEATRALLVLSYVLCLTMPLMSTLYHVFGTSHPKGGGCGTFCFRMDLTGIVLLWFARVAFEGWLVMWCDSDRFFHFFLGSLVLFAAAVPPVLLRGKLWPLAGLFLVAHAPLAYLLAVRTDWLLHPTGGAAVRRHAAMSMGGTLCAFLGGFFYFWKVPERFAPGRFDHFLQSHQIWHVFVWLGPTLILLGMETLLETLLLSKFTPCPV